MSIESAMKALSVSEPTSPVAGTEAPTIANQGVPSTSTPQEGPKTLQEAVKPVKSEERIGADRFAALAKKERAIQQQLREIRTKEQQFKEWETLRASAAQNPTKALEALGISYDQLTQFILNGQKPTPELELQGVKQEIERLRQEQVQKEQAQKKAEEERARRDYQQAMSEFSNEINEFVEQHADTYELTKMYEGQSIIQATIEQHFAQTKKIMSVEEAAKLVEKYFEDQVQAASKAKKFQAKQTPKEDGQSKGERGTKQSSPTLTNEITSSAPSLLPAKTEQDRISRAMAALNK